MIILLCRIDSHVSGNAHGIKHLIFHVQMHTLASEAPQLTLNIAYFADLLDKTNDYFAMSH